MNVPAKDARTEDRSEYLLTGQPVKPEGPRDPVPLPEAAEDGDPC